MRGRFVQLVEQFVDGGGGGPDVYSDELRRLARPVAARAVLELAGTASLRREDRYALALLVVAAGAETEDQVLTQLPALLARIMWG